MKIEGLRIKNFRGISEVSLSKLGAVVIIAGQNGSGKSCVFDAIRLLKSVYGGYQANEWHHWMGEFQINIGNISDGFRSLFNNPHQELSITCEFRLSEDERAYINNNANDLLLEKNIKDVIPDAMNQGSYQVANWGPQYQHHQEEIMKKVEEERKLLDQELSQPTITAKLTISPGNPPTILRSVALAVAFSTFRPANLGVIDYHGAQRHYAREGIQSINFNFANNELQRSQTALYNHAAKYSNVKGEMATSYIREILAEKSGSNGFSKSTLTDTLQELFATFFPGKQFLGPQPTADGTLSFPVQTANGVTHDLDELSSGEKEILYGYLRIRNSAPKHSIILLDEPELHLNPRLIRGLPQFYRKNLGDALDNQIWLVTHSDALLREVVGQDNYDVFHMLQSGKVPNGESQIKPLSASADLDLALIDMVGDLAAYRPSGKIVILEGGGDSDFDQKFLSTIFPELTEHANLLSGTNKLRVKVLHETLEKAKKEGFMHYKFYAITDQDFITEPEENTSINSQEWDVFHIENYLLVPEIIHQVLNFLELGCPLSVAEIEEELKQCAEKCISDLVRHKLENFANSMITRSIKTATDRKSTNISNSLYSAIEGTTDSINNIFKNELNLEKLKTQETTIKTEYATSLENGTWKKIIRGRDILKAFSSKHGSGTPYKKFRNAIISQMRNNGYRPEGMEAVIQRIIAD